MVPQELLAAYTEIIKAAPDVEAAGAHLLSFLLDAQKVAQVIQDTIDAAKTRAGLPPTA